MTSLLSKFKKDEEGSQKKEAKVEVVEKKKTVTKKSEKTEVKKPTKKKKEAVDFTKAYKILVKPLVSEKGSIQQANSKYFFEVVRDTNKVEIKKAIESVYGVHVVSVNIMNQRGKAVRFGRTAGSRKAWKKAVVTLQPGERITTVEGV